MSFTNWFRNWKRSFGLVGHRKPIQRPQLGMDLFEERLAPAVSIFSVSGGGVRIEASAANDVINIGGGLASGTQIIASGTNSGGTSILNNINFIEILDTSGGAGGQSVTFQDSAGGRINISGSISITGIENVIFSNPTFPVRSNGAFSIANVQQVTQTNAVQQISSGSNLTITASGTGNAIGTAANPLRVDGNGVSFAANTSAGNGNQFYDLGGAANFVQTFGGGTVDAGTGTVTITNGHLFTQGDALGDATTFNLGSGGGLAVGNDTIGGLTGTGTVAAATGGTKTLTIGGGNVSSSFAGTIKNTDPLISAGTGGPLALTKTGTGTFTLNGANSFTGGTTVNGGTLKVIGTGAANRLANNSLVTVNSGGIFEIGDTNPIPTVANAIDVTLNGGIMQLTGASNSGDHVRNISFNNGGTVRTLGTVSSFLNTNLSVNGTITVSGTSSTPALIDLANGLAIGSVTLTVADITGNANPDLVFSATTAIREVGSTVSITKAGVGTLVLGAANTYTGTTTISGGVLQLGNGGTTGSLSSGAIINNANLTVNRSNAVTLVNTISGSGSFTQAGTGATTLSTSTNSFTGAVNVNAGTLLVTASNNVLNPTTSALGNPQTAGRTFTVASGATLNFGASDVLGSGTSTPQVALVINGTVANTSNFFNVLGPVTMNGGTLHAVGGAISNFMSWGLTGGVTVGGSAASTISGTADVTAIHLAANTTFTVADATGNANPDLVVSTAIFNQVNTLNAAQMTKAGAGTMVLSGTNSYTGGTTISGGVLSVGAIADSGTSNLGLSGAITFQNGATLRYTGSGANTTARTVSANGGSGVIDVSNAAGTLTLSGTVAGGATRTLTKSGPGTLVLSGATDNTDLFLNAQAGKTILAKTNSTAAHAVAGISDLASGATVELGGTGSDQIYNGDNRTGFGLVNMSGGTFDLKGLNESIDTLTGTGTVLNGTTATTSTLFIGTASTPTNGSFSGVLSNGTGTLALTKIGNSVFTLGGGNGDTTPNTYTGTTTILGGTLRANKANGTTAIAGNIAIGDANGTDQLTLLGNNQIADTAVISFTAGGVGNSAKFNLNGFNETVAGIQSTVAGQLPVIQNTEGTAAGANEPAVLTINNSANFTYDGILRNGDGGNGSLAIVKSGTGTLTLAGASGNGYTGTTTVSAGTLQLLNMPVSTGSNIAIAAGAVLDYAIATGTVLQNTTTITGSGTLRKSGAGTLTFGVNTGGTINWQLGAGATIDVQGGTLVGGSSEKDVYTNNLADLNVAAGATFDGVEANVRVDKITGAGTIRSGFPGSGYVNFTFGVNNGTSTFGGTLVNSFAAASYVKAGTGTITLTGANTYTGTTTVNAGTLIVNGAHAGTGATTVTGANTVLGGSGSLAGPVSIQSGGAILPGDENTNATLGTGNLTIQAGASTLGVKLSTAGGALTNDQANVTGTVNVTGANLFVVAQNNALPVGTSFTIVNNDGTDAVVGTFTSLPEGAVFIPSVGTQPYRISYVGGTGNDITLTVADIANPTAAIGSAPNVTTASNPSTYTFTIQYADNVGINQGTIGSGDIQVTGPNSFNVTATFVSNIGGNPTTATYQFAAPGGTWDPADNGTYTITMVANQVFDTSGNAVAAGTIGTFTANLGAADTVPPTTSLGAANVTNANQPVPYTFTVQYTDATAVNAATFGNNNITVTLPNSTVVNATFVSATPAGNGSPLTATYSMAPPGGTWDQGDNGTYTIRIGTTGVADTLGNAISTGTTLGTFMANLDTAAPTTTLTAANVTNANQPVPYTFTVQYTDATAVSATTFGNNNITVTLPNSTVVNAIFVSATPAGNGSPLTATYSMTPPGGTWDQGDNGTYTIRIGTAGVADTVGNVITSGTTLGTFTANLAAGDTTPPTASVTANNVTFASQPNPYTFTVQYTDNVGLNLGSIGVGDIRITGPNGFNTLASLVSNSGGNPATVTYSIVPAGGTWDVSDNGTYTIAMEANQVTDTSGNAVAAGPLGTFTANLTPPDTTPPTATLTAANVTNTNQPNPYTFTVTYTDPSGFSVGSFNSNNLQVAGPNGFTVNPTITLSAPSGTTSAQNYFFTAPGGSWDAADNGTYTVRVGSTPVADALGNAMVPGVVVGTFTVSITPPAPSGRGPRIAVGGATNGSAVVFDPNSSAVYSASATIVPIPFTGNVRTAVADVNGDGFQDTIVVTGPGIPTRFAVVSGQNNSTVLVGPTAPFAGSEDFTGGGFVSAVDIDGDGRAEIVLTPDLSGGPRVTIFSVQSNGTLVVRANFFGIDDPAFRGGARSAIGDLTGDGVPELAVAAGFGGGPRITIYSGPTLLNSPTPIANFFAFPDDASTLRNGTYVAIGDVNGDGFGDLIFGGGPGGGPRVLIVNGNQVAVGNIAGALANPIANFFVAGNSNDRGGVRLATANADGDNRVEVIAASGNDAPARFRVYRGSTFTTGAEPAGAQVIDVFGGVRLLDGVYVG